MQMLFWAASMHCWVMLKLLFHQHPQLPFGRAALDLSSAQPELVLVIAQIQMQVPVPAGFHRNYTGLWTSQASLLSLQYWLWHIDCVTSRLAKYCALSPLSLFLTKMSQYRSLRNTAHHWSEDGHQAIDCNTLSATTQLNAYLPRCPSIKLVPL